MRCVQRRACPRPLHLNLFPTSTPPLINYILALGGGPGTELLGAAKYLLRRFERGMPRKIAFAVVDNIAPWAETWLQLADDVEDLFLTALEDIDVAPPVIAPSFLTLDVFDASSYEDLAYQLAKTDIVVCNYLFSENKSRLAEAVPAIEQLAELTRPGCKFVVIDRLEGTTRFRSDVTSLLESAFGAGIDGGTFAGTLDPDEDIGDMGQELRKALLSPRVKFFTSIVRNPTVFWVVFERPEKLEIK